MSFNRLRALRRAKVLGEWFEGYNVYQHRAKIATTSNTNGTNLAPGWEQGVLGHQQHYEKIRIRKRKNQNKKTLVFEMRGRFS